MPSSGKTGIIIIAGIISLQTALRLPLLTDDGVADGANAALQTLGAPNALEDEVFEVENNTVYTVLFS